MRFSRNLFVVLTYSCLTACQAPIAYVPELSAEEIHAQETSQQRMINKIKASGGMPKAWKNHKNMRAQFERVGEKIEKAGAEICLKLHLQENGCYYYFKLIRNEEINSQADGKNIIIYTGMMRFLKNDDELAMIMGHEFSHNLMGHIKAQKTNATFGMLFGAATDAIANSQGINTNGEITKIGTELGVLTYSADFEKEADYIGLYVMARAGYDISHIPTLWQRMSIEDPTGIYTSTTHPSNAERVLALQKTIYEINYKREHHLPLLPDFKTIANK